MLSVLFYVFACFALLSGIMVIRAKNPVYSVLFLIPVFCNVSGLLLLLNLDFFAILDAFKIKFGQNLLWILNFQPMYNFNL